MFILAATRVPTEMQISVEETESLERDASARESWLVMTLLWFLELNRVDCKPSGKGVVVKYEVY